MSYYHNPYYSGTKNPGCQTQVNQNPGCHNQVSQNQGCQNQVCQNPCPETKPAVQPRPACQISGCCENDTNPCCSLAVAGVVMQKPDSPTYDVENAFIAGTVFKELDKPFMGKGGCK